MWKHFRSRCSRYDGPGRAYLVATCKAPDAFPIYGFGIGRNGAPNDRYGRSLYIDIMEFLGRDNFCPTQR